MGNTLRVLSFLNYLKVVFGLKFSELVVGDDIFIVSDRLVMQQITTSLKTIYINADSQDFESDKYIKHGLGILMRDLTISANVGSFLSKFVIVRDNQVTIMRDISRACLSANLTDCINSSKNLMSKNKITWPEFNMCITMQLVEQSKNNVMLNKLIDFRLLNIPHASVEKAMTKMKHFNLIYSTDMFTNCMEDHVLLAHFNVQAQMALQDMRAAPMWFHQCFKPELFIQQNPCE